MEQQNEERNGGRLRAVRGGRMDVAPQNGREAGSEQGRERLTGGKPEAERRRDAVRDPRERPDWGRDEEIF